MCNIDNVVRGYIFDLRLRCLYGAIASRTISRRYRDGEAVWIVGTIGIRWALTWWRYWYSAGLTWRRYWYDTGADMVEVLAWYGRRHGFTRLASGKCASRKINYRTLA